MAEKEENGSLNLFGSVLAMCCTGALIPSPLFYHVSFKSFVVNLHVLMSLNTMKRSDIWRCRRTAYILMTLQGTLIDKNILTVPKWKEMLQAKMPAEKKQEMN